MKTYQIPTAGGIDALTQSEVLTPSQPKRRQVLVRMRAASLNYRDLLIISGRYGRAELPQDLVPLSDGAGEVVEVGADVTRFKPRDRVAGIFHQAWIGG